MSFQEAIERLGFTAGVPLQIFATGPDSGVPLRVRDFTFPSYLVLDFAPAPAAPFAPAAGASSSTPRG